MIELERAGLCYPQGAAALRDVTLRLEPGSLYFLTGRSGAGKSSLLKLLYMALRPTSGRVNVLGLDASTATRRQITEMRRRIGVVFQDFRLLDHLSVFENVALPLLVAGKRPEHYRADVLEMLEWVKLSDRLNDRPAHLSGGEKQRVGIARAMVSVPDIIIADEPTGSVDPEMSDRIMTLFTEMHRLGRTVLIATHDIDMVRRATAPWLHLDNGRLLIKRGPRGVSGIAA